MSELEGCPGYTSMKTQHLPLSENSRGHFERLKVKKKSGKEEQFLISIAQWIQHCSSSFFFNL